MSPSVTRKQQIYAEILALIREMKRKATPLVEELKNAAPNRP